MITTYGFRQQEGKRLLIPWSDPHKWESPFDYVFDTPKQAQDFFDGFFKDDVAPDWVLVEITTKVVQPIQP